MHTYTFNYYLNYFSGLITNCSGLYMFTEKTCRIWVDNDVKACNGSARLVQKYHYSIGFTENILRDVYQLRNKPKSMVFLSLGIHDHFNTEAVIKRLMRPLLTRKVSQNLTWPKLLWGGVHQWGLLMDYIAYPQQTVPRVMDFNKRMEGFLGPWGVPVFNTFNLTGGVMSFDGVHYGLGLNKVKAAIFLNYLLELQSKGQW